MERNSPNNSSFQTQGLPDALIPLGFLCLLLICKTAFSYLIVLPSFHLGLLFPSVLLFWILGERGIKSIVFIVFLHFSPGRFVWLVIRLATKVYLLQFSGGTMGRRIRIPGLLSKHGFPPQILVFLSFTFLFQPIHRPWLHCCIRATEDFWFILSNRIHHTSATFSLDFQSFHWGQKHSFLDTSENLLQLRLTNNSHCFLGKKCLLRRDIMQIQYSLHIRSPPAS